MSEQEQAILDQALAFSAKSRAVLIEKLLESLDQPDPSIDEQWAQEAEDRIKAYDAGKLKGIPAEDVLAKYKRS
jgi:putative addiction module component (TIGR02574 family)